MTRNRFWWEGLTCSFCQRPFPKPYGLQNTIGSQKDSSGTDRQSSGQKAESKKLADTMAPLVEKQGSMKQDDGANLDNPLKVLAAELEAGEDSP